MTAIELVESTFVIKSATLRHHLDEHGEPWFLARDVCDYLEITDVSGAASRVWDANKRKDTVMITTGGPDARTTGTRSESAELSSQRRETWLVNEPGLYQLIFTSRKPEAVAFQHWVFNELLPTLRRQGYYVMPGRQLRVGPGTGKAAHGRQPFLDVIRSRGLSAARALAGMNALDLPVPQVRETTYGNQTYGSCCVSVALATRASTYLNLPVAELFTPSSRARLAA